MRRLWGQRARQSGVRYLSVLDFGASAVKALVIERTNQQVTILGRGRASHQNGIAQDGTIGDVDALGTACEQALCQAEDATEATNSVKVVPDVALFAVPTFWLRGAVGTGSVHRSTLETGIAVEECYEPVLRAGRRAMRNLGRVTGAGEWRLLDATVVTFSVDGHRVTDPIGLRGHSLEAMSFVTAAPSKSLGALRHIADSLQLDPPCLIAEPLALAAAFPGDGLIVEVGAYTTGLVLARYGVPLACGGICQGGAVLTRVLADTFELSPFRAEALKRAYSRGQLSTDGSSAVRKVLRAPLALWMSEIVACLRSWGNVSQPWPPDVYLCGGTSTLPGVQDVVSTAHWLDVLPFPRTPQVWVWDGSNVSQVLDRTELRWQVDNVVALSLAAWALRDRGTVTPDGVLRASLEIESE